MYARDDERGELHRIEKAAGNTGVRCRRGHTKAHHAEVSSFLFNMSL